MKTLRFTFALSLLFLFCFFSGTGLAQEADTIYSGGDILTMNPAQETVEALAVKDGKIAAVGKKSELLKLKGADTKMVELGGKTLVPGFIDGHSHFINAVEMSDWANVSAPPVGKVRSIKDIIAQLDQYKAEKKPAPGQWIVGYGYDGSTLSDGRELTRDDLDPHFPNNPIVLIHVSLHGAVLNSAAFKAVGIDATTPTPEGGITIRKPGSQEPAGLLMEQSWLPVYLKLPQPPEAQMLANLKGAQNYYASHGYTTALDAPLDTPSIALYQKAAEQNLFYIDLIGYARWLEFPQMIAQGVKFNRTNYYNHYKWPAGVKIIGDGSVQAKTGLFTKPYLTGGPSGEKDWKGIPNVTQADLNKLVKLAYDNKVQVEFHANGDAAIDMFLDAHQAAGAPQGVRSTVIHSQFIRPDQLKAYVKHQLLPSFFSNHTFFWADVHLKNLGKERTEFLSPMKTARAMGLTMTNHSDSAVTPPDPLFIMWTSVNRVSRSGKVIGPNERISPMDALKSMTIDAAYQYYEEATKGSLEKGKLADLVILDANPTKIDPMKIKDIKVVETIKEGKTVYPSKK